jgi:hypothetical protein
MDRYAPDRAKTDFYVENSIFLVLEVETWPLMTWHRQFVLP